MSTHAAPCITEDEYLALEREAEFRNEYYRGQMHAMSGGTYRHAAITGNLDFQLRLALEGSRCSATSQDVRLRVTADRYYTYPDIIVVCAEIAFADDRLDTVLNPVLVVEILSPSTERYDRGFKFARYRSVQSLQEYVLVSQTEPRIEVFRRVPADWVMREFRGLDAVCRFDSVDCNIALAKIYERIAFNHDPV
jgi:Uma2 family endonuclease